MDLHSLVTNTKTAELIFNLTIQITAVSLAGWIIMKLWRPRSAPARSGGYLTILIFLAILPLISTMFDLSRITWFQQTIEIPQSYNRQYEDSDYKDMQKSEERPVNENNGSVLQDSAGENSKSFIKGNWIILAVNVFGFIWVFGFIVFILRLGFKLSFLKGYMHNLTTDDIERLENIYSTIKHVFDNRPMPEIYFSSSLSSPVTVGFIKPVMILPVEIKNIADEELKSILLHEIAHIFHGDNLTGFFQHVLSSLFWWNPVIYWLNSAYSHSREDVCDNYAIKVLESPKKYAATLLNLAEKTSLFSSTPAVTGMSLARQSLEDRVVELLKKERDLSTIYRPSIMLLSLTILILISYFGLGMRICFKDNEDTGRIEYSNVSQNAGVNDDLQTNQNKVDHLETLAIDAQKSGEYQKAIDYYDQAISVNPERFQLYVGRGIIKNVFLKDYPSALEDFRTAEKLENKFIPIKINIAVCLESMGRIEDAKVQCLTALNQLEIQLSEGSGRYIPPENAEKFKKTLNSMLQRLNKGLTVNYTIKPSPGSGWIKRPAGPFNDICFIHPEKNSMIIIGSIPLNEGATAEKMLMGWVYMMDNKYKWKSLEIESSGSTTVKGYETYYTVFEYMLASGINKEKVYFVQGESSFYRIRYGSLKSTFNESLQTFEEYFASFKIKS